MSLQLPAFEGRKCLKLSVCSIFDKPKGRKDDLPEQKDKLIAKYRSGSRTVFLRLVLPFPYYDDDRHIHLELTTSDHFRKGKAPKTNTDTKQIADLIEPFLGTKLPVYIQAIFDIPRANLIPVIRSAVGTEGGAGNIRVKMTGGTFSVQGGPVQTIAWELLETSGDVRVTLKTRKYTTLDDSYLESALDLVENTFEAFTTDEAENG